MWSKESNTLRRYKMSVALSEVYGKLKKYFKTKYRSVGILLNVHSMIQLKFEV